MREVLDKAVSPALWLSFGADSLLLLRLVKEAGFSGTIYHFGKMSDFAKQTVVEQDLTVYSWPATNRYVVPDGDTLSQVDEYLIGRTLVPFLSPVVKGDDCTHGNYTPFLRAFNYSHDITLTGYRKSDFSPAVGITFPRELDLGFTRIVNPLYDWTDEQVIEALGFTPPDENAVEYCEECLTFIASSNWDRDAALARFRSRFNFN